MPDYRLCECVLQLKQKQKLKQSNLKDFTSMANILETMEICLFLFGLYSILFYYMSIEIHAVEW